MKIKNSAGKAFDLKPGTSLEFTRLNPFFNEIGEQSIPIDLPASANNLIIAGYPNSLAHASKQAFVTDAMIEEGVFALRARQAILSAKSRDVISTSFYANEGAFNEKTKDVQLSTIFADKKIEFASVDAAVTFVRNLMITPDSRFACFPVRIKTGVLNRLGDVNADTYYNLYNAIGRTETVDEKTVTVSPGFYITPFIKANHLLAEMFAYFGYTVESNFFTTTAPFTEMVFLNNNIDTIVKGRILYSQIVPDVQVSSILDFYRKKFCCEFIPNESEKTIKIVLLNEVLSESTTTDMTPNLVGNYTVNMPEFKQIKLTAEKLEATDPTTSATRKSFTDTALNEEYESIQAIVKKYPFARLDPQIGEIYRIGFLGYTEYRQRIGSLNCNYFAGGTLEVEEKEAPDKIFDVYHTQAAGGTIPAPELIMPYIVDSRSLNSTIVYDGDTSSSSETEVSELPIMVCFCHHNGARKYDIGTIYNYDQAGNRVWDYTLCYNGSDGLFEKFWRKYDEIIRNSFFRVDADMLLTDVQKMSLSSYKKIIIDGQELLPDSIKYSPGINRPEECSFLTCRLYSPIETAPLESSLFNPVYKWEAFYEETLPGHSYMSYVTIPPVVYYDDPTEAQFTAGGRYYEQSYDVKYDDNPSGDPYLGTINVWLEAVLA
jgi:hypothetical protein